MTNLTLNKSYTLFTINQTIAFKVVKVIGTKIYSEIMKGVYSNNIYALAINEKVTSDSGGAEDYLEEISQFYECLTEEGETIIVWDAIIDFIETTELESTQTFEIKTTIQTAYASVITKNDIENLLKSALGTYGDKVSFSVLMKSSSSSAIVTQEDIVATEYENTKALLEQAVEILNGLGSMSTAISTTSRDITELNLGGTIANITEKLELINETVTSIRSNIVK